MRREIGKKGESAAKTYLLKMGLFFVAANWRCGKKEIDLIFKNTKGLFIFIEVKTRKLQKNMLPPFYQKQNKHIKRAAIAYCLQNKIALEKIRGDLIFIEYQETQARLSHFADIWR